MRRLALVLGTAIAVLGISSPANAFFHNAVTNPYLHAMLDVLTVALVTAPLWTVYFWTERRRLLMLALVALVQFPVGIIGLVPLVDPPLHLTLAIVALSLTAASLIGVRRAERSAARVPATSEAG